MVDEKRQPVDPQAYDAAYYFGSCEGYAEFIASGGAHLSDRLSQAVAAAEIGPGMRVLDVGCGRGEILCHCAAQGAQVYGVDYAPVAVAMAHGLALSEPQIRDAVAVCRADAKELPFRAGSFDRVFMLDLVEHLHRWELGQALGQVRRVLRPAGRLIIHTAPNVWYGRFAYPLVWLARTLMGQGADYPREVSTLLATKPDVHVNEQSALSLWRALRQGGFRARVWLYTPPQKRDEGPLLAAARYILFNWPPFRWFFEREVFAVARMELSR
jgi:SAM-dependent methyltransferase